MQNIIRRQSQQLGLGLEFDEGSDASVLRAIVRITGGNFRLVERLFAQIYRIVTINNLPAVTN